MKNFDPECFTTSIEWVTAPGLDDAGREQRVYSYSTAFSTYQVTFNGHHLIARTVPGEWTRTFGPRHLGIVAHFGLKIGKDARPLQTLLYADNPPLVLGTQLRSSIPDVD